MANLTRRNFIGVGVAGALGAAGLGLAGCAPQKEAEESLSSTGPDNLVWDEEYDVVVVGFGGAGGAAAIEAFDNGASVLVLDSDAMPGGATSINGGVIQCAGSSVQKAAGIEDNVDDWFDYIKAMEGPSFHEELIRPMTLETPENVDWLIGLGAEIPAEIHPSATRNIPESGLYFNDGTLDFYPDRPPTPRGHVLVGQGGGFLKAFTNGAEERGIEIRKETPVTDLVQDESGRVVGVIAESGGKEVRIGAGKGVVISTGHFNSNEAMVATHIPYVNGIEFNSSAGHPSAMGDGQRMMARHGADMVGMGEATHTLSKIPQETTIRSMHVNAACNRYWSEQGWHNDHRGSMIHKQPMQIAWCIFDDNIRAAAGDAEDDAIQCTADTIEKLAEMCALNPRALADAVARYNGYCAEGVDLEYAKDPEFLIPIEKAPFHASRLRYVWMSNGGAHIDPEAHVLDPDGNVIEGLFAAGACAHGHKSNMFNPGSGLNMAWGIFTGRHAGRNAALGQ